VRHASGCVGQIYKEVRLLAGRPPDMDTTRGYPALNEAATVTLRVADFDQVDLARYRVDIHAGVR